MRLFAVVLWFSAMMQAAQPLVRLWDREIRADEVCEYAASYERLQCISRMMEQVFGERYLRENKLGPPEEALNIIRNKMREQSARELTPDQEEFVQKIACSYYLSRALWRKHGGRVVISAFGTSSAKDGFIAELRALERTGRLSFPGGARLREDLYRHIAEVRGDGVLSGEKARQYFEKPVWEE